MHESSSVGVRTTCTSIAWQVLYHHWISSLPCQPLLSRFAYRWGGPGLYHSTAVWAKINPVGSPSPTPGGFWGKYFPLAQLESTKSPLGGRLSFWLLGWILQPLVQVNHETTVVQ
jgi:hypothetical protein